jgi:hypothetical protein
MQMMYSLTPKKKRRKKLKCFMLLTFLSDRTSLTLEAENFGLRNAH